MATSGALDHAERRISRVDRVDLWTTDHDQDHVPLIGSDNGCDSIARGAPDQDPTAVIKRVL